MYVHTCLYLYTAGTKTGRNIRLVLVLVYTVERRTEYCLGLGLRIHAVLAHVEALNLFWMDGNECTFLARSIEELPRWLGTVASASFVNKTSTNALLSLKQARWKCGAIFLALAIYKCTKRGRWCRRSRHQHCFGTGRASRRFGCTSHREQDVFLIVVQDKRIAPPLKQQLHDFQLTFFASDMQRRTLFGAAGCIQCVDGIHGSVEKCTRFGGRVVENNVTNSLRGKP